MACNYPIKCKYWDPKKRDCKLSAEGFQEMCENGINPCALHQKRIDKFAEREAIEAIRNGNEEEFWMIVNSPYTNFGK